MDIWDIMDDERQDLQINNEREIEIEYEIERVYGVPYGKYIERLDVKYFDSEEYRDIFMNLTTDIEINESIYKYAKKSIIDNWKTNKESMFLIDMDSNRLLASIEKDEDKIELGVSYTEDFKKAIDKAVNEGTRIIAIHNHPNGYPPSLDDISKMAENNYTIAFAIGANGLVYRYHNPEKKDIY